MSVIEDKEKKAISYLETILSAFDINAEIESKITEEGLFLEVSGEGMGLLIGKDGSTLSATELILNIVVNRGSEEYLRVSLDAEGYKESKKMNLERMAVEAAERVEREKAPETLNPMTPYERRIVHLTLRENTAVRTESEGEEPERYIIIKPL